MLIGQIKHKPRDTYLHESKFFFQSRIVVNIEILKFMQIYSEFKTHIIDVCICHYNENTVSYSLLFGSLIRD